MRIRYIAAVLIAWNASNVGALAQEIQVLAVGAPREALNVLGPEFTKDTGTKVTLTFINPGSTGSRLKEGTPADVVVVSTAELDALGKAGLLKPETVALIGSASVGLAVRAGAPVPDISTPDKLRATLLAAKSIAHNDPAGGTGAGIVVGRVLDQLGIADEVAKKAKFVRPATVARGEIEMVMGPIAELIAVEGITIVGPLPAELNPSTPYGAAVATKAAAPDRALAFVRYLARPESLPTLKAKGILPAKTK